MLKIHSKMKNYILLLLTVLLLTLTTQLSGQWLYSPPQPFTDSPSHKANAHLGYSSGLGQIVLWEQYTDTTSTAIWYKKYLTADDPVELIAEPGTHFRRPILISYWNSNTSLIIFERVRNGKSQLYSIEVDVNGNQSDTIPVWTSGNQNHEFTSCMDNYRVAWISDGFLLASHKIVNNGVPSFSAPDTVAFGNNRQPSITSYENPGLYWIEVGEPEDRLMFSEALYPSGWGTPQSLITESKISKKNTRWTHDDVVSWSYKNGENWQINNYQYNYGGFFPLNLTEDEPFDFAVWSSWIPLKSEFLDLEFYTLAYPKVVGDYKELFAYEHSCGGKELYQLSFLNTESRNPSFHDGEAAPFYSTYIYLVWEAEIEGFWQLYYSRFSFCWSGIDDYQLFPGVTISPNPASNEIFIQNQRELPLMISIYDDKGSVLFEKYVSSPSFTIPVLNWPGGLYIVNFVSGKNQIAKKIVLE